MVNRILTQILHRWRLLFLILVPLVVLPLPIVLNNPPAKCGYLVLILTLYWISEVIPLAVTSLLPLIFFPMAGVLEPESVAQSYFKDITVLFFGSLALAHAVESVNLHRRVALFVLSLVGSSTQWSMAGLMAVTAFLSMWINNVAAASIMVTVSLALIDELESDAKEQEQHDEEQATKLSVVEDDVLELTGTTTLTGRNSAAEIIVDPIHIEGKKGEVAVQVKNGFRFPWQKRTSINVVLPKRKKYDDIRKGFLLATAYSATIGGLGTLVGSGPNILVKGIIEDVYKGTAFRVNFANFLLFAMPVSLIMLILCWLWLQILYNRQEFFRCKKDSQVLEAQAKLKAMLVQQYKDLGKPSWNEYCVAIVFIIMVVLWLTKDFGETRGWSIIFPEGYITDSTIAMFCGILPLILPNSNPFKSGWKYEPVIHWNNLSKHISWGVIFLLGAGLAIAAAFTESGLSDTVAQELRFLANIPRVAVISIVIIISALFTQVTSNLSTASIFFPVLDAVACSAGIHPGYLILPCTLAVSLAFMLPIATPPNAIVFSSGAIRVIDMIKTGIVMNIIGFFVVLLASTTWMSKIYDLDNQALDLICRTNKTNF